MGKKRHQFLRCSGLVLFLIVGFVLGPIGCGSSSNTPSSASATSISELPSVSTLVATDSSSPSIIKAVSGTPPVLKDISESNVDTYFWNGLLATITAAGSATSSQISSYWQGEGACRMAQTVGYAFQNILQGGTSLCYMQNMPNAANGVAIVSGSASTPSEVFNQGSDSKIVQAQVKNSDKIPGGGGGGIDTIFIKVFGTGSSEGSAGYAVDLWFCNSSGTITGYEQLRLNSGAFTSTNVNQDANGSYVGTISASLTTNASGQLIFDTAKDRSAVVYYTPPDASNKFFGTVKVDSAGLLTARNYQSGSFGGGPSQTSKRAIYAQFSGSTMATLSFSTASFALQDVFGTTNQSVTGATEYRDTNYTSIDSGDLLTSAVNDKFDDAIYTGDETSYKAKLSETSNYSCKATPDVVVSMDMSASGPAAVASQCENGFSNMIFCDSSTVNTARQLVFSSQENLFGSCPTSSCTGDFSCQQWADNNLGNAQGITTANAKCSNGCCATQ